MAPRLRRVRLDGYHIVRNAEDGADAARFEGNVDETGGLDGNGRCRQVEFFFVSADGVCWG